MGQNSLFFALGAGENGLFLRGRGKRGTVLVLFSGSKIQHTSLGEGGY